MSFEFFFQNVVVSSAERMKHEGHHSFVGESFLSTWIWSYSYLGHCVWTNVDLGQRILGFLDESQNFQNIDWDWVTGGSITVWWWQLLWKCTDCGADPYTKSSLNYCIYCILNMERTCAQILVVMETKSCRNSNEFPYLNWLTGWRWDQQPTKIHHDCAILNTGQNNLPLPCTLTKKHSATGRAKQQLNRSNVDISWDADVLANWLAFR